MTGGQVQNVDCQLAPTGLAYADDMTVHLVSGVTLEAVDAGNLLGCYSAITLDYDKYGVKFDGLDVKAAVEAAETDIPVNSTLTFTMTNMDIANGGYNGIKVGYSTDGGVTYETLAVLPADVHTKEVSYTFDKSGGQYMIAPVWVVSNLGIKDLTAVGSVGEWLGGTMTNVLDTNSTGICDTTDAKLLKVDRYSIPNSTPATSIYNANTVPTITAVLGGTSSVPDVINVDNVVELTITFNADTMTSYAFNTVATPTITFADPEMKLVGTPTTDGDSITFTVRYTVTAA